MSLDEKSEKFVDERRDVLEKMRKAGITVNKLMVTKIYDYWGKKIYVAAVIDGLVVYAPESGVKFLRLEQKKPYRHIHR